MTTWQEAYEQYKKDVETFREWKDQKANYSHVSWCMGVKSGIMQCSDYLKAVMTNEQT